MEFFVGDALAAGADLFIAGGSFDQSNHARVAAAAARAAGIRSLIVARPGGRHPGPQGNGLLTRLLADEFLVLDELADAPADRLAEVAVRARAFERLAEDRRGRGDRPYVVTGTTIPLGAMGYVAGGLELVDQLADAGIERPTVAITSAGATQAGSRDRQPRPRRAVPAPGPGLCADERRGPGVGRRDRRRGRRAARHRSRARGLVNRQRRRRGGAGLWRAHRRERDALRLAAHLEGIFLDPVYTATGLAGLIRLARSGRISPTDTVVFIHTGGLPAMFAYSAEILGG